MDEDKLFQVGPPPFYLTTLDDSDLANLYLRVTARRKGAVTRSVRGKKSRTLSSFFDEIAAALQFPYYFGENWPALDEVITDLDWLEGEAYLLIISDAPLLLSAEPAASFRILLECLARANEAWVTPNAYIPRDRPPTPFHVLFQSRAAQLSTFTRRLAEAGFQVELLPL